MALTKELIQALSGENVFLRGEEYYRAGFVKSFTWKDSKACADVVGSKRKPYQVVVVFHRGRPSVKCNCDQGVKGGFCKHAVAFLLHLLDLGETGESKQQEDDLDYQERVEDLELSFKDAFFYSFEEPVVLQLGLSIKHLSASSLQPIPFSMMIKVKQEQMLVTDLDDFEDTFFSEETAFPSIDAFNRKQQHVIEMLRSFSLRPEKYAQHVVWRLLPFQVAMLLGAIDDGCGIEIVDLITKKPIALRKDPLLRMQLILSKRPNHVLSIRTRLVDGLETFDDGKERNLFQDRQTWVFNEDILSFCLLDTHVDGRLYHYFLSEERLLDQQKKQYFFLSMLPKMKEHVLLQTTEVFKQMNSKEKFDRCKVCYQIDVEFKELVIDVIFVYGNLSVKYHPKPNSCFLEEEQEGESFFIRRNFKEENERLEEFLNETKVVFDEHQNSFRIKDPQECFYFLTQKVEVLRQKSEVLLKEKALRLLKYGSSLEIKVRLRSLGIDWFSYDVSFMQDGQPIDIPLSLIQDGLKSGKKFVQLKTGEFVSLEGDVLKKLTSVLNVNGKEESPLKNLDSRLMLAHIPFMMEGLKEAGVEVQLDDQTAQLYQELKEFKGIQEVEPPASVKNILRDYQKHGLDWLGFLRKFRFGGILSDEMGLGKTLQALSIIVNAKKEGIKKPSLVVCPTTLVWNWEHEIHKFFTDMNVLVANGQDRRSRLKDISNIDIVITSYALLRRDIACYEACDFYYLVLDEAQNIKNRHTLSAQVTKRLKADYRLALTGTPLENSIADLWSIFDFLMPSFLGEYEYFRTLYESPIVNDQNHEKIKELSKRISPFVLRRLKQDVIKELPEKIEQTIFCELEPAQAKLYASLADKARQQVLKVYQQSGFGKGKMLMLTLLLRLRQMCCHPHLAGMALKHDIGISAKTDLFKEMLLEAVLSGHRVLVFSQFVEMLKILRTSLEDENISFEYMDGQTKDRQERVERFNKNKDIKVFLLSLKVGGLGLNLTSADTVILYEPWWNPSVEQQAIDRAHRIGQKKAVVAYHLIAKGTIEERILELQERKRGMMDSLIFSEKKVFKSLGWEDIKFLLDLKE